MQMLDNLKSNLTRFTPDQKTVIILVVFLFFIGISVYIYKTQIQPKLNPNFVANKEFVPKEGDGEEAEIMFFFTQWCPHCKKATPHWDKFKEQYDGQFVNNHKILCKEYDCDKNEKMCDKYKIDGYPTIKMLKNDQIIDFDAKPTIENLTKFVETAL